MCNLYTVRQYEAPTRSPPETHIHMCLYECLVLWLTMGVCVLSVVRFESCCRCRWWRVAWLLRICIAYMKTNLLYMYILHAEVHQLQHLWLVFAVQQHKRNTWPDHCWGWCCNYNASLVVELGCFGRGQQDYGDSGA